MTYANISPALATWNRLIFPSTMSQENTAASALSRSVTTTLWTRSSVSTALSHDYVDKILSKCSKYCSTALFHDSVDKFVYECFLYCFALFCDCDAVDKIVHRYCFVS